MPSRNLFFISSALATIAAIYLGCTNLAPVALSGFGAPVQLPLAVVVIISYLFGLVSIGSFWLTRKSRQIAGEQKLVQWANQDQKLIAEIASDKEKQLEAKIATLDVALKSALKKKCELEQKLNATESR